MKKILIIEDTPGILENTAELLELSNYEVYTAPNGKAGVEQAIAHQPNLIICDIMMPELDGYGVLHMIQKHALLRHIPFIFLTAKTEAADVRKGMGLGADDYITKPFDHTDLLNTIEARLRKAEAIQQKVPEIPESQSAETALKNFVEGRHLYTYRKKQLIFTEGNHPSRIYYLQKGKIKIFKTNEDGKELIINLTGPGEFFGHIALWEGTTYKMNAEALEDCAVAAIPRTEFEDLLRNHPDVVFYFMALLVNDSAGKDEKMLKIAYNSLRKKVADTLVSIKEKYENGQESFAISISRENLACLAGTATESLIRTLTDFKHEKLIDIREGKVVITNERKLKQMAN